MSNIHDLKTPSQPKATMAEEIFFKWYEMTKALPHDYMEEVFGVFHSKLERYKKKIGNDHISNAETITCFKSAINKVASQQAMSRFGRMMDDED